MDPMKENHRNHVTRQQHQQEHHLYHQHQQQHISPPVVPTASVSAADRYFPSSNHFASSLPSPQPALPPQPQQSHSVTGPSVPTLTGQRPYRHPQTQSSFGEQSSMLQHIPPASSSSPAASPTPPTLSPPSPSSPLPPMSPSPTSLSSASFTLTPLPPPLPSSGTTTTIDDQDYTCSPTAATVPSCTAAASPVDSCTTMSLSDSFVSQSASLCFQPNTDLSPTPPQHYTDSYYTPTEHGGDIDKQTSEDVFSYPQPSKSDSEGRKEQSPDKAKVIQPCHYQRLPYHIRSRPRPQRWESKSLLSPSAPLENLCEEDAAGTVRCRKSSSGSTTRLENGRETGYGSGGGGVHSSESGSFSAVSSSGSLDGVGGFSNRGPLKAQTNKRDGVKCKQKKSRPLSETRDNLLDQATPIERPTICKRLSTPDLTGTAGSTSGAVGWSVHSSGHSAGVRTAVMVSRRGYKHEVVRAKPGEDSSSNYYSERQRLLSSPKHSSSYPVLKRLAAPPGNSHTSSKFGGVDGFLEEGESPGTGELRLGKQHRHNSDTTVTRGPLYGVGGGGGGDGGGPRMSSMVKSGSFLRQLGDRLWSPLKRGADLTLALRRSVDREDTDITSPLTPPSPPSYGSSKADRSPGSIGSDVITQEVSRSKGRDPCSEDIEDRALKGGAKALLIQKRKQSSRRGTAEVDILWAGLEFPVCPIVDRLHQSWRRQLIR
ncbi:hypothetical protein RRG08_019778 [Elysia crispata]|uniref:Uncharacterized protein n=1 Tax=Elysia crispata TaxID=231223 RepID=A0AAE1E6U6_9GAST|nr:hypothetical protein RRG08_019778 [Elysia crispata]